MTKYTFICESDGNTTVKTITCIDDATWGTPLFEFFNFLKGCGYLFKLNEELAVADNDTGDYRTGRDY